MSNKNRILRFFFALFCITGAFALCGQSGSGSQQVQSITGSSFIAISPNDRYVITDVGEVLDVKKGAVLHKGLSLGYNSQIVMMNDNRHYVALHDSKIKVADYLNNKVLKSLYSDFGITEMKVSYDGQWTH